MENLQTIDPQNVDPQTMVHNFSPMSTTPITVAFQSYTVELCQLDHYILLRQQHTYQHTYQHNYDKKIHSLTQYDTPTMNYFIK